MADAFSATFDASSPEWQRTIDFNQEDVTAVRNEYNFSVIDAAGDSVSGTVPGMVSVDIWSPGADRAETTENAADLSTNCRKFRAFNDVSVSRAVFSVTGLGAGLRVVVTAIRTNRSPR